MRRLSAVTPISMGLALLTISVLLAAHLLGLVPDEREPRIQARKDLCETLATQLSLSAARNDTRTIRMAVHSLVERNNDVLSAGVRGSDGAVLVATVGHEDLWADIPADVCTPEHMQIPILRNGETWATVQVVFAPLQGSGPAGFLKSPIVRLVLFISALGFLAYLGYLRKVLRHLDPSAVIPERVKAMLDTLAEGVIIFDRDQRIVMANASICKLIGAPVDQLLGRSADGLPWKLPDGEDKPAEYPWQEALRLGQSRMGVPLCLAPHKAERKMLTVNAAVIGDDRAPRGVLATFDDVTGIEQMNVKLRSMLKMLEESRSEIERQNRELQILSTRDPLTGCLNRRAFFEELENHWQGGRRYGYKVGFIMLDLDHFKKINDNHGHSMGDRVLKEVTRIVKQTLRTHDVVGRYGGEEFCLLLPHTDANQAAMAAERIRQAVEETNWGELKVTVSLGVTGTDCDAKDAQQMLNQADEALYAAKNGGRNRAVSWSPDIEKTKSAEKSAAAMNGRGDRG